MREIIFHNEPIELSESLQMPDYAIKHEAEPVIARIFSAEDAVQSVMKLSEEFLKRRANRAAPKRPNSPSHEVTLY